MRLRRGWGVPLGASARRTGESAPEPTRPVLPITLSCVPTEGNDGQIFLVPAHYRHPLGGLDDASIRIVTALDRRGRLVRLPAYETEVTAEARRFLDVVRSGTPQYEYCPVQIPEEVWDAYERLVPEEWTFGRGKEDGTETFAVRGRMPDSFVAKIPVQGGYAQVPLAPRVSRSETSSRGEPMFRLALRDVVRVQTAREFADELGVTLVDEVRS